MSVMFTIMLSYVSLLLLTDPDEDMMYDDWLKIRDTLKEASVGAGPVLVHSQTGRRACEFTS